jgi:hypothetical protein
MADKALVTLLIGETFTAWWHRWFEASWRAYAHRHEYDIILITNPIDRGPRAQARSPHWQKLLILEVPEVRRYRHVVWIDADILINHHTAPSIVDGMSDGRIGAVSYRHEFAIPGRFEQRYDRRSRSDTGRGWPSFPDWYEAAGLPRDVDNFTNTGVLVLEPARHAAFLRDVYERFGETPSSLQENGALSYQLFKSGMLRPLDHRFNVAWNGEIAEKYPFLLNPRNFHDQHLVSCCVNAAWHNAWFLHFVASASREHVQLIETDVANPIAFTPKVPAG